MTIENMGAEMLKHMTRPDLLRTSPLAGSQKTAEILAQAFERVAPGIAPALIDRPRARCESPPRLYLRQRE